MHGAINLGNLCVGSDATNVPAKKTKKTSAARVPLPDTSASSIQRVFLHLRERWAPIVEAHIAERSGAEVAIEELTVLQSDLQVLDAIFDQIRPKSFASAEETQAQASGSRYKISSRSLLYGALAACMLKDHGHSSPPHCLSLSIVI